MAAAAALARLEQRQPRARGPVSQDSIRNQGELRLSSSRNRGWPGGGTRTLASHPRGQSMGVDRSQVLCLARDENNYITNNFGGLQSHNFESG